VEEKSKLKIGESFARQTLFIFLNVIYIGGILGSCIIVTCGRYDSPARCADNVMIRNGNCSL
jgi:hypothetical protein